MKIAIFAFFVFAFNVFDQSYANGALDKPACGKTGLTLGKNGIPPNGGTITFGKTSGGCEQNEGTGYIGDGTRVTSTHGTDIQGTGTQCGDSTLPSQPPTKIPPTGGNQCGGDGSPPAEKPPPTGGSQCGSGTPPTSPCDDKSECKDRDYPAGGALGGMIGKLLSCF